METYQCLQRSPAETPEDSVTENHGNKGIRLWRGDRAISRVLGARRQHIDGNIHEARKEGAPKEQGTTSKLVDKERSEDTSDECSDGIDTINQELAAGIHDTNLLNHDRKVVADDGASDEVGEDSNKDHQPHAQPVGSVVPQDGIIPVLVLDVRLSLEKLLHLVDLEPDQCRIGIIVAMVFG